MYFNRVPAHINAEIIESKFKEIQKEVNQDKEPNLYNFISHIRDIISKHVTGVKNSQSVIIWNVLDPTQSKKICNDICKKKAIFNPKDVFQVGLNQE